MSITSTTLYEPYRKRNHSASDQTISNYLHEVLENKRKPNEIDTLKVRLQEKALVLEKSKTIRIKNTNKTKKKRVSSKQIKKLGLHIIPKTGQKYQNFLPLNQLWKKYIRNTFSNNTGIVDIRADDRMLKLDYHGAELSIYNSKCKSYIGIKGIILKETKNTMFLITHFNEVKIIPKKNTIFMFELDSFRVKLNGDIMVGRPGVRLTKKIKPLAKADLLVS